jgi:hypothetical protein
MSTVSHGLRFSRKECVFTAWLKSKCLDDVLQLILTGMRKITVIGICIILFGTSLAVYSMSQTGNIGMENRHLVARGTLILGFVMMVGGGLIAMSPFGRK